MTDRDFAKLRAWAAAGPPLTTSVLAGSPIAMTITDVECEACGGSLAECACPEGPEITADGDRLPCPWCGYAIRDLWEFGGDGETSEGDCDDCGKSFTVTTTVSVDYSARRAKENG